MPASQGSPTVPYDDYPHLRIQLRIMHENYPEWKGRDRLDVFNFINKALLTTAGFSNGTIDSFDKLDSQWRESRKDKNAAKWQRILVDPLDMTDEEHREYCRMYEFIKLAASQLGKSKATVNYYDGSDEEESDFEEGEGDDEVLKKVEDAAVKKAEQAKKANKSLTVASKGPDLELEGSGQGIRLSAAALRMPVEELKKEMDRAQKKQK